MKTFSQIHKTKKRKIHLPLASQSLKETEPSYLVMSPPPQEKQRTRPGSGWYEPSGQSWHGRKPSAEK